MNEGAPKDLDRIATEQLARARELGLNVVPEHTITVTAPNGEELVQQIVNIIDWFETGDKSDEDKKSAEDKLRTIYMEHLWDDNSK